MIGCRRDAGNAAVIALRRDGNHTQVAFACAAQAADDAVIEAGPCRVGAMAVFTMSGHEETHLSNLSYKYILMKPAPQIRGNIHFF